MHASFHTSVHVESRRRFASLRFLAACRLVSGRDKLTHEGRERPALPHPRHRRSLADKTSAPSWSSFDAPRGIRTFPSITRREHSRFVGTQPLVSNSIVRPVVAA